MTRKIEFWGRNCRSYVNVENPCARHRYDNAAPATIVPVRWSPPYPSLPGLARLGMASCEDAAPDAARARGSTAGPEQGAAGARRPSNPEDPRLTYFTRSSTHMRAAFPIPLPRASASIRSAARAAQGDERGARVTARAHCSGQVLLCACARCAR